MLEVSTLKYYEIIRELREDRDLTQKQVADILGIAQTTYSQYELNKRQLPTECLITLCRYYGVAADYVLCLPKNLKYPER